jgi:hypothetical protein
MEMTLREKFIDAFKSGKRFDIQNAEKIADEFAIGFAEWLYRYDNTRLPNGNWIIKLGLKPYTSEEVLEIYKKEKGL